MTATPRHFMCTYHGWTYANDGALKHVPGESEAYYDALDRSSLGLIEARIDTYAGIVFATWAPDAPSLEAYLGDARWYLDTLFNRRDCGMQALGPVKWIEPVNWKTLVDNCSDNYHVPTTHRSSALVQSRYLGRPRLSHEEQFKSPNKHVFVNGHSLTFREVSDNTPRYVHGMSRETVQIFQEYHDATLPEVERRLGTFRARRIQLGQPQPLPQRDPGVPAGAPAWPAPDRVLALRAAREGRSGGDQAGDPDRKPGEQRCRRAVRARRRRQLAPGDGGQPEPHRPPVPPGSVDGDRSRGRASRTTRGWCPIATSPRTTSGTSTCAGRSS